MTAAALSEALSFAGTALATAAGVLAEAGCESPRLDAELLLAEVLRTDRAGLVRAPERPLSVPEAERFQGLVERRAAREPVAYVLGRKAFRHLELAVDRRVLVPRPETELLVEAALELPAGARVLDVGTGSGAVALALKHERPDLRVAACDSSRGALEVAAANARRLGLAVELLEADLMRGLAGGFDAVVANLPYVSEAQWPTLAPEIVDHEPRRAVVGGPDGLAPTGRLIAQAAGTPFLAVEVGLGQAEAAARAMREAGYGRVESRRDLAGIERVVVARSA